jgi:hypothetical protein
MFETNFLASAAFHDHSLCQLTMPSYVYIELNFYAAMNY